jgi:2-deoxy-D-gluconate 3-dehydrogenase
MKHSLFDLTGRVALVAGGSRGLGAAMARALRSFGSTVYVASRSAVDTRENERTIYGVTADIATDAGRRTAVDTVMQRSGKIDVLLFAAGQQHRAPAESFEMSRWNEILNLHLTAAMDLSQLVAKDMLARGHGKIILISSILGFQGGITVPAYSAAKHAVVGLAKALSNEWAMHGINVNSIAPGYFAVGVGERVMNDAVRGPQIMSRIPAGKAGDPTDLDGPVVFLASDASRYVHGHTLVVDGGWLGR